MVANRSVAQEIPLSIYGNRKFGTPDDETSEVILGRYLFGNRKVGGAVMPDAFFAAGGANGVVTIWHESPITDAQLVAGGHTEDVGLHIVYGHNQSGNSSQPRGAIDCSVATYSAGSQNFTVQPMYSGAFAGYHAGTGTIDDLRGVVGRIMQMNATGGVVTLGTAVYAMSPTVTRAGGVATAVGVYVDAQTGANLTAGYGVFIETAKTLSLYVEGGGISLNGTLQAGGTGGAVGFMGATPVVRQTVTGAKGGNAALTNLLTTLATIGLITNSTT